MARDVAVEIKGLKKAMSVMDGLPKRTKKKIISKSMKQAAKPMVKDAKREVPVDSGKLKRSIGSWVKKTKNPELFVVKVGPRQSGRWAGYHGHLVEFGTDRMAAQPYLRPAYNSNKRSYVSNMEKSVLDGIHKEAEKMMSTGKITR